MRRRETAREMKILPQHLYHCSSLIRAGADQCPPPLMRDGGLPERLEGEEGALLALRRGREGSVPPLEEVHGAMVVVEPPGGHPRGADGDLILRKTVFFEFFFVSLVTVWPRGWGPMLLPW